MYNGSVRWRALALLVCLTAFGCGNDSFSPPEQPDLYKHPYDFSLMRDGGVDLSVPDLGKPEDLSKKHPDLSMPDAGPERG